ncbi:Dehydroquinate synthase-like protein [Atractiella rhizophila]|nr:Dehydroquinate synthase-like protein [Atractiella rhizophila]
MATRGTYTPTPLSAIHYGEGKLKELPTILKSLFPDSNGKLPKSLIITGKSIATKTPLLKDIQKLLGNSVIATYTDIGEHAPIKGVEEAAATAKEKGVEVIISLGGGSPIDAAKLVGYFNAQNGGAFIPSVAIPTTLSAAELTMTAGYTNTEGHKAGAGDPRMAPKVIIYDPHVSLHTPERLWLSSGIRAVDHAVETLYRPRASVPARYAAIDALEVLFTALPACKKDPSSLPARQEAFVGAWMSLGTNVVPHVLGLSHSLGHALGATYSIPHGITSCLTLAPTIKLLLSSNSLSPNVIKFLARAHDRLPEKYRKETGEKEEEKAYALADAVQLLVTELGLESKAGSYGVKEEDCRELGIKVSRNLLGCDGGWSDDGLGEKLPSAREIGELVRRVL